MEIDNLNKNQKIYLTYKIFNYWNEGKIVYKKNKLLPISFGINNMESILKVYLTCSRINKDGEVDKVMNDFEKLNIYEKLDFMIYLFDMVNDIELVPNRISNNYSLKDLSNRLLEYKLLL